MKVNTIIVLASAVTLASAIPNPWPAPTAVVDERDASPMTCLTDDVGTRCLPDRAKRTAVPEPAELDAREPKQAKCSKTTSKPAPKPTITTSAATSSSAAIIADNGCWANEHTTHCDNTVPQCNTFVGEDGKTSTGCILKRGAVPEPTAAPTLFEERDALVARGWYSSNGGLCTVEKKKTRCVPNTPSCTTSVVSGTTQVACVL